MAKKRTIAFGQILAATDFSSRSDHAVQAALGLAQHFGAQLHVFHVASDASGKTTAEAKLDATAEEVEGIHVVKAVSTRQPAPEIVKYARRNKIDLIVLGTHGRSGLTRVLMGSVAEAVLRTAPCQVLTIGPNVEQVAGQTRASVEVLPIPRQRHCLVCAQPSDQTICDSCKAHIRGEAPERKRREERVGGRGLSV